MTSYTCVCICMCKPEMGRVTETLAPATGRDKPSSTSVNLNKPSISGLCPSVFFQIFFLNAVGQTLRPKQHLCPSPHFHNPGTRPDCKAGLSRGAVWCCGCAKAMAAVTPRARLDPPPAVSSQLPSAQPRRELLSPAKPAETPSLPCTRLDFWSFRSLSHLTLGQMGDRPFSRAAAPLDFMDQQTPTTVTATMATSKARHELSLRGSPSPIP